MQVSPGGDVSLGRMMGASRGARRWERRRTRRPKRLCGGSSLPYHNPFITAELWYAGASGPLQGGHVEISVAEASERMRLSAATVRRLAQAGDLSARKVGGTWLVADGDVASFALRRGRGRPVSARSAWAILDLLEGRFPAGLSRSELARSRKRARNAGGLSPGDLAARARLLRLKGPPGADRRVRNDPRLVRSGVSASRSAGLGIVAAGTVEGYIRHDDIDPLMRDYRLQAAPADAATVLLHVPEGCWPLRDAEEAPVAVSALDLLDSGDPRSVREAHRLLRQLARQVR